MQNPTCTGVRVRSAQDAHKIFSAVLQETLPMITRRLSLHEQRQISSGSVYVWEERGQYSTSRIERWTDGVRWLPSRIHGDFLVYQEDCSHHPEPFDSGSDSSQSESSNAYALYRKSLIKQTYSAFVNCPSGPRKWHLVAYSTRKSRPLLKTVEEDRLLGSIEVPTDIFRCARSTTRARPVDQELPSPSINPRALRPSVYSTYSLSLPSYSPPRRADTESSSSPESSPSDFKLLSQSRKLPPLAYLNDQAPAMRHPLDEIALMSLHNGTILSS